MNIDKDNYSAFVRFVRKLLAARPDNDTEKEKLRKEIGQTPILTEKDWILKQMNASWQTQKKPDIRK